MRHARDIPERKTGSRRIAPSNPTPVAARDSGARLTRPSRMRLRTSCPARDKTIRRAASRPVAAGCRRRSARTEAGGPRARADLFYVRFYAWLIRHLQLDVCGTQRLNSALFAG